MGKPFPITYAILIVEADVALLSATVLILAAIQRVLVAAEVTRL